LDEEWNDKKIQIKHIPGKQYESRHKTSKIEPPIAIKCTIMQNQETALDNAEPEI